MSQSEPNAETVPDLPSDCQGVVASQRRDFILTYADRQRPALANLIQIGFAVSNLDAHKRRSNPIRDGRRTLRRPVDENVHEMSLRTGQVLALGKKADFVAHR